MDFQNSPQNGNAHSLPIFVFYELRTFEIDQSTESFGKLNIDMTCFNVTTEQKEQSQGDQESKDIDDDGGDGDDDKLMK